MSRRNLIVETVSVTLVLFVLVLLFQSVLLSGILRRIGHSFIPLTCILLPWIILKRRREPLREFGIHLEDFSRSLRTGILISFLLLTPYFIIFALWYKGPSVDLSGWTMITRWLKMALYQFCYIAFPEEFFFRGYLQTRLNQSLGKPFQLLGAQTGWGIFLTALVFMLFHLVYAVNLWTLGVLLPALIFGWLREKTGSITASTVFHALSNIILFTLQGRF